MTKLGPEDTVESKSCTTQKGFRIDQIKVVILCKWDENIQTLVPFRALFWALPKNC